VRRSKRTATWRIVTRTAACVAALLWAAPVAAQTWGVKGGLNLSDVTLEDFDTSAEPSAVAGGFFRLPFIAGMQIQVEGLVAQRRVTFDDSVRDELNYLEVPMLARYRVLSVGGRPVHALGGGVLAFRLSAKEVFSGGESEDVKDSYEPVEFGVAVGGEVTLTRHWLADVRYVFGVMNIYDIPGFDAKFRTWQVTVGYGF
jgi:hypothetical protein